MSGQIDKYRITSGRDEGGYVARVMSETTMDWCYVSHVHKTDAEAFGEAVAWVQDEVSVQ